MGDADTSARHAGLSAAAAAHQLAEDGPNALPDDARRGWRDTAAGILREPMFVLLLGAAALYLLLGDPRESLFLGLMVLLMLGLTFYQEGRTARALKSLRALSAPAATVIRDGVRLRIPAAAVVRGDLLALAEGDRVPADALVLECTGLLVDESLLTGESLPVGKLPGDPSGDHPAPDGDDQHWVCAGTLVLQGEGLARVRATGAASQLGAIGAALHGIHPPDSRLQREVRTLVRRVALLGIGASVLLVLLLGLRGIGWLQALLAGVALSMSLLPEEFPAVLSMLPAIGAWRLARHHVLTRRLAAIEILGSTSVLCVDKTGTLTENRMQLRHLWRDGVDHDLAVGGPMAAPLRELLDVARLAGRPGSPDPMEQALAAAGGRESGGPAHEYGLTPARPALVRVWSGAHDRPAIAAAKGAPETIARLCGLGAGAPALAAAAALAREGRRVLAVAVAHAPAPPWPAEPTQLGLRLLGLIAFADPLRPDIPQAVAACQRAGIRMLMVTGDHPETARAIARQAGIAEGDVLTGPEIASLAPAALAAHLKGASVCARIVPSQKLAIVRALQRDGAVVAMTGDGVNDAPALRAADVGVAMGGRGTEVARESAELTLLDDRFASLVVALRVGRRIFANMRKSMCYLAAVHVPIALLALLPPLLGWPTLLYPPHIAFLELLINPACSLAFESEPDEPDLMLRPPRAPGDALLDGRAFLAALARGLWTALVLAACFRLAIGALPEAQARATGFIALIMANLALLLGSRSQGGVVAALRAPNPWFAAIAAGGVTMLAAALYVTGIAALLRFAPPPPAWIGAALLAGAASLLLAPRLPPSVSTSRGRHETVPHPR